MKVNTTLLVHWKGKGAVFYIMIGEFYSVLCNPFNLTLSQYKRITSSNYIGNCTHT
jgi:hypothetical protein